MFSHLQEKMMVYTNVRNLDVIEPFAQITVEENTSNDNIKVVHIQELPVPMAVENRIQ